LQPADLGALHALSVAAGWPHRSEDCALLLDLGEGLVACAPSGGIVGAAMAWRWADFCAGIGMVLVAAAHQGQGIGRRLMSGLLDAMPAHAVMLNATQAGFALYERLGFRPLTEVTQHQGVIPTPAARPALRLARHADLAQLIALDRAGFGAGRARLVERLMVEGEVRVLERSGRLCGFAARRAFGHGETIGPLLAETETDAITLAAGVLGRGFQRIDIPAHAPRLAAWASQAGLVPVDTVTTMTHGPWPPPVGPTQRFAVATQALG
jgi:ribosomal protein S18 acetylase RimI-like enzyme